MCILVEQVPAVLLHEGFTFSFLDLVVDFDRLLTNLWFVVDELELLSASLLLRIRHGDGDNGAGGCRRLRVRGYSILLYPARFSFSRKNRSMKFG